MQDHVLIRQNVDNNNNVKHTYNLCFPLCTDLTWTPVSNLTTCNWSKPERNGVHKFLTDRVKQNKIVKVTTTTSLLLRENSIYLFHGLPERSWLATISGVSSIVILWTPVIITLFAIILLDLFCICSEDGKSRMVGICTCFSLDCSHRRLGIRMYSPLTVDYYVHFFQTQAVPGPRTPVSLARAAQEAIAPNPRDPTTDHLADGGTAPLCRWRRPHPPLPPSHPPVFLLASLLICCSSMFSFRIWVFKPLMPPFPDCAGGGIREGCCGHFSRSRVSSRSVGSGTCGLWGAVGCAGWRRWDLLG